jgi:hypothetical protein
MAAAGEERVVEVRLTKGQATAAGAVLRGYLAHQRERLGDRADTNPNFKLVDGALRALEAGLGEPREGRA